MRPIHVVLTGPRAVGKSTIDLEVARRLEMRFVDLDEMVLERLVNRAWSMSGMRMVKTPRERWSVSYWGISSGSLRWCWPSVGEFQRFRLQSNSSMPRDNGMPP